jgi:hypothetical protein
VRAFLDGGSCIDHLIYRIIRNPSLGLIETKEVKKEKSKKPRRMIRVDLGKDKKSEG